ncbi:uncharacterized protein LOC120359476 [Solenopsis invicta]|uniref:uncharacterized protein LOC120359476 n=1 Tax=Solenopsis invicta TaxID=13686 RepID=UPI00193DACFE|nr:uncharacterized protein LOC120359476 [Solenopsis invicta]
MADIVSMFREIRIHPDDADLQRILWRADPSEEVRDYRLTTVTYGTASAFLALRTLRQLVQDESSRFLRGSEVLGRHSYVDDILAGGDSLDEVRDVQEQLAALLRVGGFALSKWASNWRDLCPRSDQEERLFSTEEAVGALGVIWNPQSDTLALRVFPFGDSRSEVPLAMTKRGALLVIAKLFDPFEWAAPVLVFAKIFLQDLCLTGCGWDDPLPTELTQSWQTFQASLQQLEDVRLLR